MEDSTGNRTIVSDASSPDCPTEQKLETLRETHGVIRTNSTLSSYFRKTGTRRSPRMNLISINGKKDNTQLSFRSSTALNTNNLTGGIDESNIKPQDDVKRNEEPFSFGFNLKKEDDAGKSQSSPFLFEFDLKEDNSQRKKKNKKRRNKKKQSKDNSRKEMDHGLETNATGTTSSSRVMHDSKSSTSGINHTETDSKKTPQKVENGMKEASKTSEFVQAIRTPPGFSSRIMRKKPNTEISLSQQIDNLRQNGLDQEQSPIDQSERILQFRSSDKGRAMVNRGSLAVRKEISRDRMKEPNDLEEDNNAFSFGFTFDSLLKDYL